MTNREQNDTREIKPIFISYSRKDIETVTAIKEEIERNIEMACWMDMEGITAGTDNYKKAIIQAINSCPIFLFMLSEESQKSENALKELDFAYEKYREEGKKVVIVYIEKCKMSDELRYDYQRADTIDWQNKEQREKLIRNLRSWTNYHNSQHPKFQLAFSKRNYDIFLSRNKKDMVEAERLRLFFESYGLSVFDPDLLLPSKNMVDYARAIDQAIELSDNLIVLCSPNELGTGDGNSSNWVNHSWCLFRYELLYKRKKGNLFTILKGVDVNDLDIGLRQYEAFQMDDIESSGILNHFNILPKFQNIHERINLLVNEYQEVLLHQNRISENLCSNMMAIGRHHKVCPVCNQEVSVSSTFCDRCSWQFPVLFGVGEKNSVQGGGTQLSLARMIWEKTILNKDAIERLNREKDVLTKQIDQLMSTVTNQKKIIGDLQKDAVLLENKKSMEIWDKEDILCLKTLVGHTDWICSVKYSPDGLRLASASSDNTIKIWDAVEGHLLKTLEGHEDEVVAVAFSPDGRLIASASCDQTVRLWDVITGKCLLIFRGHTNGVYDVSFSPTGHQLISASMDKTIRVWDIGTTKSHSLEGHSGGIAAVSFSPDGKHIVSTSSDNTIKIWDGASVECTLEGHVDTVWDAEFSPDGKRIVSASADQTVRIWNVDSGKCIMTLNNHRSTVWAASYSPDGKYIASSSSDNSIIIWDSTTGLKIRELTGHADGVWGVSFSPDGRKLASASKDRTVKLWGPSKNAD